jgi:hypothetical protein
MIKIINNYILTPTKIRNYKLMPSLLLLFRNQCSRWLSHTLDCPRFNYQGYGC